MLVHFRSKAHQFKAVDLNVSIPFVKFSKMQALMGKISINL